MSEARVGRFLLALALAATALVYAPGYAGYWLGDDYANLHRAYVWAVDGETRERLFGLLSRSVSEGAAFFRPAIIASFAVDFLLSGTRYAGWFLFNHAAHLANVALVAMIVRRLAARAGLDAGLSAAIAALLFGLSPVLAEGVWWLSARSDASVSVLTLLGVWAWIGRPDARPRVVLLPLLLIPALLFKESAALLPLQAGLLWLAMPELRERRRGVALLASAAVVFAFLAWRAHLFGDAWQVYGGEAPGGGSLERLAAVAESLPHWALGWAGGNATALRLHLGLLVLAAPLALAFAHRRWIVLALAAAGGGALLATFLNLGALAGNGEGGRLFYSPLAYFALAIGMACARLPRVAERSALRSTALAAGALAALSGAVLLWPLLQTVWGTQSALRQAAAALPSVAGQTGAMLLLLPDRVGPVVAVRNGQAAFVLRPLQPEGLLHRVLPTLPHELAGRHGQYAGGLLDQLEAARLQHWDADVAPVEPAERRPRFPERIGCWSTADGALVQFAAPSPEDPATWAQQILVDARARGCLLD